ncbi:cytochrome b [Varunaivibrio sulfuroxidans]|uniref:Cytochrome b n=1 Tax=Varunaivibrio sulfuroxidans TaxID=1773489 RepID=A0A4R3J6G0_9PROT|nr:cytochrome b N-terminal domain-containing protein [Varunaivibrio sulfuroxidans]TCS60914.1 ubiquinol-cytochrome c reductase cytochrome b subunit [Varunaivibrio sulfuroxidans]WES31678.1 cytochrome b N-terminal domain-containing protein [Varunaivibrio sulfuroxidans]
MQENQTKRNKLVEWIDYRLPIFSYTDHNVISYPTPKNLNWMWNFGSLAGIVLVIMIASGVFLAMNYQPNTAIAFQSVERIVRDVNYGWLLRYIHMNGASMFFVLVYIHMFRGLYYGSYKAPRELLWMIGVVIYVTMMATAFMGYVLPWGQMSFWGATVITNLFSAIPVIGTHIVNWIWGGFSVDLPTLNRFFVWHYLLPMILFMFVVVHLWALHVHKSNNPLGIDIKSKDDVMPFHPYYTIKDLVGLGVFMMVFLFFVFFYPNFFGEPDNYIPANPMVTPPHIVPEWYFLPFYAILRAVPDKLGGVIVMFSGVLILFVLPWLDTSKVRSATFRPIYKQLFWIFVLDCILLGIVGSKPPDYAFFGLIKGVLVGRAATIYYFFHFLVLMPLVGKLEKPKPLPNSINEEVIKACRAKED